MSEQDDKIKELLEKAEALYNEGKYKEAIEVLLEANELKPNDYNILQLLVKSYYMDNQSEKGIKYLSEALELKPNDIIRKKIFEKGKRESSENDYSNIKDRILISYNSNIFSLPKVKNKE